MIAASEPHVDIPNLDALRRGGKAALARALVQVEQAGETEAAVKLIDSAYLHPRGHVIGLTGPPGVGKSTLIDVLIRTWRASGTTVGVIAIDPSSDRTKGAFLGDRVRMRTDPDDDGAFVRSLASRGRLGGLADLAFPFMVLMRAVYDCVIIETVGVGQSETEITALADTVVMCIQPGSGDALQFMKAGVIEIPDIALVTKSDSGTPARRALSDLRSALSLTGDDGTPCLMISASTREGIGDFLSALETRFASLAGGQLEERREQQAQAWLRSAVQQRYGDAGLAETSGAIDLPAGAGPYGHISALSKRLSLTFSPSPDG